jgi:hypothetical protein
MKLTRRQLKKLIFESINSERSGAVINKLTKEQIKKLKGLLAPYLDTLKDNRDNYKNTESPEYGTFIQGEQLIHAFLEQKENPGDYPGVSEIYNKIIKPYYQNSTVIHLNELSDYVLWFQESDRWHPNLYRPDDFTSHFRKDEPPGKFSDFSKHEKLFRKGMEMLVKLFEASDSMAPLIYKEKVLSVIKRCDFFIDELESQLEDELETIANPWDPERAEAIIKNTQSRVDNVQKLLGGESAWVVIKKIIADYPISIDEEKQNTVSPDGK